MKKNLIILLLISSFISLYGMQKEVIDEEKLKSKDQQISWQNLPLELKQYILSLVSSAKSMEGIFEDLSNAAKVNKEFRSLAKDLVYDPKVVENLAKRYIEQNPGKAYNDFIMAISQGNQSIVKALVNTGIEVNPLPETAEHEPILFLPIIYNHKEIVEILIDAGSDVNAKNAVNRTMLMAAANSSSKEIVRMLLTAGSDVNARDCNGNTALIKASSKEIAQMLIEYGADVNAKDERGNTPLIKAAENNRRDVVELLLNKGANPNSVNTYGEDALMCIEEELCKLNFQKKKSGGQLPEMDSLIASAEEIIKMLKNTQK